MMVLLMIFKITSIILVGGMIYFLRGLILQDKKTLEFFEKFMDK
jgi:hypothetical protein